MFTATALRAHIATPRELGGLSRLSVQLGNVPFIPGHATVSVLEADEEIIGFAAAQTAVHAAGSWVKEEYRRQGYSYVLRECLDNELRRRGFPIYFALPSSDFEKQLFAKYGRVTEQAPVQIRHL